MPPPILLYDGVCGLCNRFVQFTLRRDRKAIFRFASLQSAFATRILTRHGADPRDLDTVYIVVNFDLAKQDSAGENPDERVLARSEAVLFVLRTLGGVWGSLETFLRLVPKPLRDWGYGLVARHRYRIFGRYAACPLPNPGTQSRFLDS